MFVTCIIHPNIYGSSSGDTKKIIVDVDPNDEVENLKVLVTLQLTEIDPAGLQVYYHEKKLPENIKIIKLNLQPEEFLILKRKSSSACTLI